MPVPSVQLNELKQYLLDCSTFIAMLEHRPSTPLSGDERVAVKTVLTALKGMSDIFENRCDLDSILSAIDKIAEELGNARRNGGTLFALEERLQVSGYLLVTTPVRTVEIQSAGQVVHRHVSRELISIPCSILDQDDLSEDATPKAHAAHLKDFIKMHKGPKGAATEIVKSALKKANRENRAQLLRNGTATLLKQGHLTPRLDSRDVLASILQALFSGALPSQVREYAETVFTLRQRDIDKLRVESEQRVADSRARKKPIKRTDRHRLQVNRRAART